MYGEKFDLPVNLKRFAGGGGRRNFRLRVVVAEPKAMLLTFFVD